METISKNIKRCVNGKCAVNTIPRPPHRDPKIHRGTAGEESTCSGWWCVCLCVYV